MKKPILTEWARISLANAIGALSKALGQRSDAEIFEITTHLKQAERDIAEVWNQINPSVTWEPEDANLSSAAHTYLRKLADDLIGGVIYEMVETDKGMNAWHTFISNLKISPHVALDAVRNFTNSDSENRLMSRLIRAWGLQNIKLLYKSVVQS